MTADGDDRQTEKVRPRDRIRDYIRREIGSIEAWESVYGSDGKPLPSQMIENRQALLAMTVLLDAIEARPTVMALLSKPAPPPARSPKK